MLQAKVLMVDVAWNRLGDERRFSESVCLLSVVYREDAKMRHVDKGTR